MSPNDPGEEFDLLMTLARSGDERACEIIYKQHHRYVLHVIRHGLLRDETLRQRFGSDDLTQIVFQRVFERIRAGGTFDSHHQFIAYLNSVGRYVCLEVRRNHIQAAKRSLQREVYAPQLDVPARGSAGADPAQLSADADELRCLLASLDRVERLVVEMICAQQGRESIARNLGISVSTVDRVLRRLRRGGGGSALATSEQTSIAQNSLRLITGRESQ